jgi:hypothetical protein
VLQRGFGVLEQVFCLAKFGAGALQFRFEREQATAFVRVRAASNRPAELHEGAV